jgi:DNA anti-recombination protein RmuC
MTDAQLVTLATAFLAAVIAVLFNNSRISDLRGEVTTRTGDLRNSMDKRFDDMNGHMDKRFDDMNRHIDDKFALLTERLQRMEDNIMRITGDHEERIQKLEGKK